MRNLLNFILRNSHWMLAILLIAFSFYLVFSHNTYQRSVYLTSANNVIGWVYKASNNISSFFNSKKNNQLLLEQNALLENELLTLRATIDSFLESDSLNTNIFIADTADQVQFDFIPAEVSNVSFSGVNNYITLNKGSAHGIKADMGVISQRGVVGVVYKVSTNFSVVIPIINPKFRLSAKLKNSENNGSISWDGNSMTEAQIGELPKQEPFQKGDTVLTSYSRIFPKNRIIGFVSSIGESKDDNFNTFNIELATDFNSVQYVFVINDSFYEELKELEGTLQE